MISRQARPGRWARRCGCTTSPAALRIGKLHKRLTTERGARPTCPRCPPTGWCRRYLYYDAAADDARLTLDRRPHRGAATTARWSPTGSPRSGVTKDAAGRVAGVDGRGRRRALSTVARRRRGQRRRRVGRRRPGPRRGRPTPTPSARPRASTSPCRGTRCATTSPRSSRCPRTSARCSWCRGATSPTSAPPTPTTTAPSTTRSAPPRTSPTCCGAINGASRRARSPTRRHRRHVGRPAAAGQGRRPAAAPPTCPAGTRCTARDSGVVTITGGKLTTYRRDGRRHRRRGRRARARPGRATPASRQQPHQEAAPPRRRRATTTLDDRGRRLPVARRRRWCEHLADRYGGEARAVLMAIDRGRPAPWPSRSCPACPTCGPRPSSRRATRWPARVDDVLVAAHPGPPAGPRRLGRRRRRGRPRSSAPSWAGTRPSRRRPVDDVPSRRSTARAPRSAAPARDRTWRPLLAGRRLTADAGRR